MSDDERDIRTLLEAEAERAPRPQGLQAATVRRGSRGRMGVVALPLLVAASVAWVAVASPFSGDARPRVVGPGPGSSDGRIVFSRFDDSGGIMTMNADGSDVQQLMSGDGHAIDDLAWAPDGSFIAFHGYFAPVDNEEGALFIVRPDGTDLQQLTTKGGDRPSWSPDTRSVTYHDDGRIYVINIASGGSQPLFPDADEAEWSPQGDRVLSIYRSGTFNLSFRDYRRSPSVEYPMHRIDSRPARPDWAPDGTRFAFTQFQGDGPNGVISIVDADGKNLRELTQGASPSWSPDGTRIAFERTDEDGAHIYSINVDGTDERQLTFGDVADHSPDWGPAIDEPGPPDCREVGEGGYRFAVTPSPAAPGSTATISGAIPMYGEGGQYIPPPPDKALHFWIDVDPENWQDLIDSKGSPNAYFRPDTHPAEGTYLGAVDLSDPALCDYRFEFEVPDVDPDAHTIVGMIFTSDGAVPMTDGESLVVGQPECPPIDVASDEYGLQTWQRLADPGTRIFVGGPTLRGEDGRWAASDRLELWWNTDTPSGEPIADGPALNVSTVTDMDGCFFDTDFQVPNANPGRYQVSAFIFDASADGSYGHFGTFRFEVPEPRHGGGGTEYQIGRARITNYTDGGYLITFDATWLAEGEPQPETCHYEIQDGTGHQLTEGDFKLDVEGRNIEQPFDVPQGEEPRWLELFCAGEMF